MRACAWSEWTASFANDTLCNRASLFVVVQTYLCIAYTCRTQDLQGRQKWTRNAGTRWRTQILERSARRENLSRRTHRRRTSQRREQFLLQAYRHSFRRSTRHASSRLRLTTSLRPPPPPAHSSLTPQTHTPAQQCCSPHHSPLPRSLTTHPSTLRHAATQACPVSARWQQQTRSRTAPHNTRPQPLSQPQPIPQPSQQPQQQPNAQPQPGGHQL